MHTAKELHDWLEASNLFEPDARQIILRALSLLASVESSGDDVVCNLRSDARVSRRMGQCDQAETMEEAAARITLDAQERAALKAELASVKANAESSGDEVVRGLAGFTPGPWEWLGENSLWGGERGKSGALEEIFSASDDGKDYGMHSAIISHHWDKNVAEANRKLIAAAPQLLAHIIALQAAKVKTEGELASVRAHAEALKERIWQIRCELGALFTMLPGEVPGLAMEVCERDEDRKCLFRAFELAAHPKDAP